MRIPFRRITSEPQAFSLEEAGVEITGTLMRMKSSLVLCKATIRGVVEVECFRCGTPFDIMPSDEVAFLVSDGVFHGQDDAYDVVEMHEGVIDFKAILVSEIGMIHSEYHACEACR